MIQGHTGWEVVDKEQHCCFYHGGVAREGFAADGELPDGLVGRCCRFAIFSQDVVFKLSDGVGHAVELVGIDPFITENVRDVTELVAYLLDLDLCRLGYRRKRGEMIG